LNSGTLILSKHGIIAVFTNNLHGLWDFFPDTNLGAGSPKTIGVENFHTDGDQKKSLVNHTKDFKN
jgi:hypothetical protein